MTKQELAEIRKKQIIEATIECITRYGYNNFSMQDVAQVADVSKGIIHYYFLNKEELMGAVLDKVATDIENLLGNVMKQTQDPVERLRALLRTCLSIVKEKREFYCINIDFWTQINHKEKVRGAIAQHYAKFRSTAALIIQEGMDAGIFRQGNANMLASQIIALADGISLQWLFDENVFDFEEMVKLCEESTLRFVLKEPTP